MFLVRIIYVSKRNKSNSLDDLNQILQVAQANNQRHELTGLLAFNHQYFLQVLEGGRAEVSQLLGNLYADPRHSDLTVLEFDHIDRRVFGEWSMQFVPATAISKEMLLRYGATSRFEPHKFSKSSALDLLTELRQFAQKKLEA